MPKEITKGSITREEKEQLRKEEIKRKAQEAKFKKWQKDNNTKVKSLYISTITKAYIEEFTNNYGNSFDYNTLIDSLEFHFKEDKDGNLLPNYKFNYDKVTFKSDAKKECREFNENSYTDFISNEDSIEGVDLNLNTFYSLEEFDEYQEAEKKDEFKIDEIQDGRFIPISDNADRYGGFNKINKTVGYTPVNESGENADKTAINKWNKIKAK